ncbi:hypothetical protein V8G54_028468, partial [Vigna mungo]
LKSQNQLRSRRTPTIVPPTYRENKTETRSREGNLTSPDKNPKNRTPIRSPNMNRTRIRRRKEEKFPALSTQEQRRGRRRVSPCTMRNPHYWVCSKKKEVPKMEVF